MMSIDFDIIICGAGPAGCTAALAMGSSGLKVAMIDKMSSPGEKICGDALPPFIPKVLDTIDHRYYEAFHELAQKNPVTSFSVTGPAGKTISLKFPDEGYLCKRVVFDSFLFNLCGNLKNITFIHDTIKEVSVSNDLGEIRTMSDSLVRSRLILGCDGANSLVRQKLGGSKTGPADISVAVRAYFKGIAGSLPGTIEFHFKKQLLPGYFWIFPLPGDEFNVGLGLPSAMITEKRINLKKEFERIIESDPLTGPRFDRAIMTKEMGTHAIPVYAGKVPLSGDHFMLCGDAGSLVNPATGGGIGHAMQSGRYAAWQAIRCFREKDFSAQFMKRYDSVVQNTINRENRRYSLIRNFVLPGPGLLDTCIDLGRRNRTVRRIIIKALGGL